MTPTIKEMASAATNPVITAPSASTGSNNSCFGVSEKQQQQTQLTNVIVQIY